MSDFSVRNLGPRSPAQRTAGGEVSRPAPTRDVDGEAAPAAASTPNAPEAPRPKGWLRRLFGGRDERPAAQATMPLPQQPGLVIRPYATKVQSSADAAIAASASASSAAARATPSPPPEIDGQELAPPRTAPSGGRDSRPTSGAEGPPRPAWSSEPRFVPSFRGTLLRSLAPSTPAASTARVEQSGFFQAPKAPKLFAGVQVKVPGESSTVELVGVATSGRGVVRDRGGAIRTVDVVEVPAGQDFRSVLEALPAHDRHLMQSSQATLSAVLAHKVAGGETVGDYVSAIRDRGYEAFICGGAVRDLLQGKNPRDVDLATTMWVEDAQDAFRAAGLKTGSTRAQFGTALVGFGDEGLDVCSLKGDGYFGLDLKQDVKSRDFTINALYYDPVNNVVGDPTGHGVDDVKGKTLRPTFPPGQEKEWLAKNPSAALRLFKFSARGYTPTPECLEAVKDGFSRAVGAMDSWRRSRMLTSVGLSSSELANEMRRLGFSDQHIRLVAPLEARGWSRDVGDDASDVRGGWMRPSTATSTSTDPIGSSPRSFGKTK